MRHETEFPRISDEELAGMGNGRIAYMRQISGREIAAAFPGAVQMPDDALVWALFSADGTPLALAEDAGGALGSAMENNLTAVSVH